MAHTAGWAAEGGVESVTPKPGSPLPPAGDSTSSPAWGSWRMQQPQPERRYQLFPKPGPLPLLSAGKPPNLNHPDQAFAHAMGLPPPPHNPPPPPLPAATTTIPSTSTSSTSAVTGTTGTTGAGVQPSEGKSGIGLRLKIKEHGLIRRRKVSVPELGPMTTVQEAAMDSPTIPGRPPLHERSISAPGHGGKLGVVVGIAGGGTTPEGPSIFFNDPWTDRIPEVEPASPAALGPGPGPSPATVIIASPPPNASAPLSPRHQLAPLVIPVQHQQHQHQTAPTGLVVPTTRPSRQLSLSRTRSGSNPGESAAAAGRGEDSPRTARTPYTPVSASSAAFLPQRSATVTSATSSSLLYGYPTSAGSGPDTRVSARPWEPATGRLTPPGGVSTSQDWNTTPKSESAAAAAAAAAAAGTTNSGHRRGQSDSYSSGGGLSIMERGRPRNRLDRRIGTAAKKVDEKRATSAERRAFEELPDGVRPHEAAGRIGQTHMDALYQQAVGQAARFEVLRAEDVEALSRELRQLDERTEYLRRTYTSLRAGRRNLHTRICQYLRSPLVATFRSESMLKQEEALAELDASIDDWVTKLEQAENRRTRVRQKLLEHVAAALILPVGGAVAASSSSSPSSPSPLGPAMAAETSPAAAESLQRLVATPSATLMGVGNISTPPRSPTKPLFSGGSHHGRSGSSSSGSSSPSPHHAVAHVPSTILEQPIVEEVAAIEDSLGEQERQRQNHHNHHHHHNHNHHHNHRGHHFTSRRDVVESIRIYADRDVYALLADVENEITKMGRASPSPAAAGDDEGYDRDIHRAQSHEMLIGLGVTENPTAAADLGNKTMPRTPSPPSPPSKNSPTLSAAAATAATAAGPAISTGDDFILSRAVFKSEQPSAMV